ncbi:hypothetical protein G7Z17_g11010 [Cylindrodendrum hubeiense]|uniref:Chromo domain-containing protein n=1 Tax=Cylindrodendrum hubeiense TaxID=595255 RepID=A0A9P5H111_9HYPO|nr:hypothetical protein G7Z17_g11010 [Cylindrodendrum hubeiense]
MLPPRPSADPYDVPASPQRAVRKDATDSPMTRRSLSAAPVRDTIIRRSLSAAPARDTKRDNDTTVTAASGAPDKKEIENGTFSPKKTDTPDKQTPKKKADEAKPAAEEAPAAASSTPAKTDLGELEIERFDSHRIDETNATVDISVVWESGEKSWESEWSLQNQVPALVFKYWDALEGREAATGLDVYHVFRILKRATPPKAKKNRYMYQVQWVGYRRSEATWEHEDKIKEIAPDELIKFEAKNGAASDAPPQKRVGGRGPGRPRKKAKTSE